MKVFFIILGMVSLNLWGADDLNAYKKRFRTIRDEEGRALRIIDRSLHSKLSFQNVLNQKKTIPK